MQNNFSNDIFDPEFEKKVENHIGLKIKEYRQARGLTQKTLADYLGVSFQQVQKYEQGRNRVSAGRLIMMASVLKIPVSFFFYEGQPEKTAEILQREIWFESLQQIKNPKLLYHLLNLILHANETTKQN